MSERRPIPVPPRNAIPSVDYYNQALGEYGDVPFIEAADATARLSAQDMIPALAKRKYDRYKMDQEDKETLSIEEIYEEMEARGIRPERPITRPLSRSALEHVMERQERRRDLQNIIARGPEGALAAGGLFLAGMAPHVFDPVAHLVGGVAGYAARTAYRAGKTTQMINAARQGMTFRQAAGQAFIGNLAVEPAYLIGNDQDFVDYTLTDSVMNVVGGSIGLTALTHGVPSLIRGGAQYLKGRQNAPVALSQSASAGKQASGQMIETSVSQAVSGKKVDVSQIYNDATRPPQTDGMTASLSQGSTARQMSVSRIEAAPNAYGGAYFYGVRTITGEGNVPINSRNYVPISSNYGEGVYLTNAPDHAVQMASRDFAGSGTRLDQVALSENLNLLDMDAPSTDFMRGYAADLMKEAGLGNNAIRRAIQPDMTNQQAFDIVDAIARANRVSFDPVQRLNESLGQQNFDGIRGTRQTDGIAKGSDQIMVFEGREAKFNSSQEFVPPPVEAMAPESSFDYARAELDSPEIHHLEYDPQVERTIQDLDARAEALDTQVGEMGFDAVRDARAELDNLAAMRQEIEASGELTEGLRRQFDDMQGRIESSERERSALKSIASRCLGGRSGQ